MYTLALWAIPGYTGRELSGTGWSCPGWETKGSLATQPRDMSADREKERVRT